jgi:hypothetical protein
LSTNSVSRVGRQQEVTKNSSTHTKKVNICSCEGIIDNLHLKNISTPLTYFHKYGTLHDSTAYCYFQLIGGYPQLYSMKCINDGKVRTKKGENGQRCDSCKEILKSNMLKR